MSKREKAYKSSSRIVGQLLEAAYSISRLLQPRRSGLAIAASFTSALNWSAGNAGASKAALESGAGPFRLDHIVHLIANCSEGTN